MKNQDLERRMTRLDDDVSRLSREVASLRDLVMGVAEQNAPKLLPPGVYGCTISSVERRTGRVSPYFQLELCDIKDMNRPGSVILYPTKKLWMNLPTRKLWPTIKVCEDFDLERPIQSIGQALSTWIEDWLVLLEGRDALATVKTDSFDGREHNKVTELRPA